ncbi:M20 family metallopeptidase [Alkalilimnicola ehrlichii]|uniref:M20 family metallopeptidase n=1 Tax=Alkalilimnicola ehrlichii TaxID=351052 RepID=UPI001C6EE67D|nr:M20 family metallopeptidase [Alkalilimnicola ehrlichii]
MDIQKTRRRIEEIWDNSIIPTLAEYIRIPNKSPHFDPHWVENGHMDAAVALIEAWCRQHALPGMTLEVIRLPGRTPLLYMDIPGTGDDCVLLYGHLDKQPEMSGWHPELDPWKPVLKDDKLYGRGGADDGYAAFASLTALRLLHEQGISHSRCVILIEACEESGSYDLPFYIDALAHRIGTPSLVVCLDSGCGNYEQLWCTTSLRGMASGVLRCHVLAEGVHSGDASGIVPSSFRILRQLLDRLEDPATGAILPAAFHADIPAERYRQAQAAAQVLGDGVFNKFALKGDTRPVTTDRAELILNRTWRPALAVTGAAGLPPLENAGNVLRPSTSLKLSLRLPPIIDGELANAALKRLLEAEPPYGSEVVFEPEQAVTGWNAPSLAPWLGEALEQSSQRWFGGRAMYMGEGGSIPFMGMLGEKFPHAQFMITGVLGPNSNAHGPNEFLHIPTAKS